MRLTELVFRMNLRLPPKWLSQSDERIMEFLTVEGPRSPTRIVRDDRICLSRQYANKRLKVLASAGLVRNIGNGVYEITAEGESYLEGSVDCRDLPDPTDEN